MPTDFRRYISEPAANTKSEYHRKGERCKLAVDLPIKRWPSGGAGMCVTAGKGFALWCYSSNRMDYEAIIRNLVREGNEFDKVDFKSSFDLGSKLSRARLAKLVNAIVNCDNEELENFGYIIIGAERQRLIGGCVFFAKDQDCSTLARGINSYQDPPVQLDIRGFNDATVGWFGAIVIRPRLAITGPHFIGKAYSDTQLVLNTGDVFVRVGEEVRRAQRADFERMYSAKYSLEVERIINASRSPVPTVSATLYAGSLNLGTNPLETPPAAPVKSFEEERALAKRHRVTTRQTGVGTVSLALFGAEDQITKNAAVNEYLTDLDRYEKDLKTFAEVSTTTFRIALVVRCDGTTPVRNAEIDIIIPDGCMACDKVPELPTEPRKPYFMEAKRRTGISSLYPEYDQLSPVLAGIQSVNWIDQGPTVSGNTVKYKLRELKHGREYDRFDDFFLTVPRNLQNTEIRIHTYADNLPEPSIALIPLSVKAADDGQWERHICNLMNYHEETDGG
jgi:hypothetical protein